jgi:hypothetical protein
LLCGGNALLNIGGGALLGATFGIGVLIAPSGLMPAIGAATGLFGYISAAEDIRANGPNLCNFMNLITSLVAFTGSAYSGLSGGIGGGPRLELCGVTCGRGSSGTVAIPRPVTGNTTGVTTVAGTLGVLSLMASTGGGNNSTPTRIEISRSRHPEAADHIEDAQNAGHPKRLTIDRAGKDARRAAALEGYPLKPGFDRDEYPPAVFKEGGAGASVRYIKIFDNRGAGSILRWAIDGLPDGTIVIIEVVP